VPHCADWQPLLLWAGEQLGCLRQSAHSLLSLRRITRSVHCAQPRLSDAAREVALHIDAAMVHAANAKHDAAVRALSEESG
jgi:hypothetical protein